MANSSPDDASLEQCPCKPSLRKMQCALEVFGEFVLKQMRPYTSPEAASAFRKADLIKVYQQIEKAFQLMKQFTSAIVERHSAEKATSICNQSPVPASHSDASTQTELTADSPLVEEVDLLDLDLSPENIDWLLGELKNSLQTEPSLPVALPPSTSTASSSAQMIDDVTLPKTFTSKTECATEESESELSSDTASEYSPPSPPKKKKKKAVQPPRRIIAKGLNCPECEETFQLRGSLLTHLRQRHSIRPYRCHVRRCDASFNKPQQLADHQTVHHKLLLWPCDSCDKAFPTALDLKEHFQESHEEGRFACPSDGCPFVAKYRVKVSKHLKKHPIASAPMFACPFAGCSRSFKHPSELTRHQLSHRPAKVSKRNRRSSLGFRLKKSRFTVQEKRQMLDRKVKNKK